MPTTPRQCFIFENGDRACGSVLTDDGVTFRITIDRIEINRPITPEDAAQAVELAKQGMTVAFTVPPELEVSC